VDRRAGGVRPNGVEKEKAVGDRVVAYGLKFVLGVLNWAARVGDGEGGTLIERNPLQGLPSPRSAALAAWS